MFVGITNTPRDYAWGAPGAISELLGAEPTSTPEAELWLGAHPGSPSRVVGSDDTLIDVVDGRLPFLLKVLAAGSPLSLQAHPTSEQAAAGFARENAAGIPLDAPHRNYKDAFHKPELIYALSDDFEALCGFRDLGALRADLEILRALDGADGPVAAWIGRLDGSLREVFDWLISRGDRVDELVETLTSLANDSTPLLATLQLLAARYPGDPGIAISLMLNRVSLQRGEALYLPEGNIHAYLRGVGIELMASSDNVLRGGLTHKHVDVPQLLEILDFTPFSAHTMKAVKPVPCVKVFAPDVPDFILTVVNLDANTTIADVWVGHRAIALCVTGEFALTDGAETKRVRRGDAFYVEPNGDMLTAAGHGLLFLASGHRGS
jgi:mannose-6-phosphate isomerase